MASYDISRIAEAINAGQHLHAEQLSRAALLESPRDENLLLFLALSLQFQGRSQEALPVYAELTQLQPASSVHWNNYATVLAELGARREAVTAYARAVELDPGNTTAKSQLGLQLIELRDYLPARSVLLDVVNLEPNSVQARIDAARACCHCQDVEGAAELLRHWRHWAPFDSDQQQLELAQVLTLKHEIPGAAELLEDLLARWPGHHDVRLLLATLYERLNRLDDADAVLAEVIRADANTSGVQRNEANHILATLASRRKDPATARDLLERTGPASATNYSHYFQLASVCDQLGDTKASMNALRVGHQLEASERRFDSPEYFRSDAPAMPVDAPRVSAEQYARWPAYTAPAMQDSPVFVVGFPRSGTTLLEQMLDAHPGLQSMDENPFFNCLAGILGNHDRRILDDLSVLRQYDCDELRKRYDVMVGERIQRNAGTRLVDKNPLNMQWLPMIHRLFPNAKIILAVRHPCDVVLSCYMQSFQSSGLAAACSTLERLSRAYVQTMACWLEDVETFKPSVLVSRYEDLVGEFPAQATRIAQFLELEDASPMLQFDQHARNKTYIATPSYSQVIEPVNRKGLGRWHKYRDEFEPLLPILDPMLRHWGYAVDAED
ncbi:tetratricopeptide repeat-containing sulfotransferase family protein [Dyella soli]|uniref:Sulfotransferase family protein n=1 Tax=Dyella soli TaxID=522319 RepID=A0A4R0YX69_9GAMM|nr:tetratricopeptide repeat-containing sulfotransferase family protein [Dyella soli]TCI11252.1 sulfotransferase family protein [Dyella soli]